MANDRAVPANRTSPRQQVQRDHAGVDVVFRLWQCDKENHGWREGPSRDRSLPSFRSRWPGLHPPAKSDSNEKRIQLCTAGGDPLRTLAALKAPLGQCYPTNSPLQDLCTDGRQPVSDHLKT